jgi:hypothetical protein
MNTQIRHSMARGLLIVLYLCSSPAVLQNMRTATADGRATGTAAATEQTGCRGIDARLARERADAAARKSEYRLAGQCYLIAGDKPKADLNFIKATAAESATTKRQLAANENQVKEQFRQWRAAFASH